MAGDCRASPSEPESRWGHRAVYCNSRVYLWGGCTSSSPKIHNGTQKQDFMSRIFVLDTVAHEWSLEIASGNPPLGIRDFSSVVLGTDRLLQFGGYCGHDYCWHNSLHALYVNCERLQWEELLPDITPDATVPMKKQDCGVVCYEDIATGSPTLCVFGGAGCNNGRHWEATNELHLFHVSGNKWSSPTISGLSPPPCHGFSFVKTGKHNVILFGGIVGKKEGGSPSDQLYSLSLNDMAWRQITPSGPEKPRCRVNQGSLVVGERLLVVGGLDTNDKVLNDVWSLNTKTYKWKIVSSVPSIVSKRAAHSVTSCEFNAATTTDSSLRSFVVFGGLTKFVRGEAHSKQPMISHTVIADLQESTENGDLCIDDCFDLTFMGRLARKYKNLLAAKENEIVHLKQQLSKTQAEARQSLLQRLSSLDLSSPSEPSTSLPSTPRSDLLPAETSLIFDKTFDIKTVVEAISDITEWYPLGVSLGLHTATLDTIEAQCDTVLMCKMKVIEYWMKHMDNCKDSSWENLALAIKGDLIKNRTLAEKIEKKYI